MKIKRFLTSVNAANCYICWCDETQDGVLIDPAEFSDEMLEWINANRVKLTGILITHGHYDHDGGIGDVLQHFDIAILAAKKYPKGKLAKENEIIRFGNCQLKAVATPGHTKDSISFICDDFAIVGDAIFAAAVGGTSNRKDFEQETEAIRKQLFSLPPMTTLYPGHGPATTIAVERAYNPFFLE